jgi:uncharacterized protein
MWGTRCITSTAALTHFTFGFPKPFSVDRLVLDMAIEHLELLDWKRRIFELYQAIRAAPDPRTAWASWRAVRDGLFATHAQSPIPRSERARFPGLPYFDYEPSARVLANVEPAEAASYDLHTSGGGTYRFVRFGVAGFDLQGHALALELYWLEGYGGGIFLPFRDATSGAETYGAGRYLLDSVKGADLGIENGRLVLDFNFAYHPSCVYDPRWVCPLAPPANRLLVPIRAGERLPAG